MTFIVNKKQCDTCIFGPHSPIPPERFEDLKSQWEAKNIVQQCHQASTQGKDTACRGHYEAARRGDIPHPMQNVFGPISIEQTMRIAETLGFVKFVDVKKKGKES